eukprot:gene23871-30976_t
MKRTGMAAMVTVYGARSRAEAMIAGIGQMHGRVSGVTPDGQPYRADDPELLDWVQATASYGFMEAYHRFVRTLTADERDAFYAEAAPAARLYGATGAPTSVAAQEACFEAMRPRLERSEIVTEFLDIMRRTPILPGPLRAAQGLFIRAAVELLPLLWQIILRGFILNTRPRKSAHAYSQVWRDDGSPLAAFTRLQSVALAGNTGEAVVLENVQLNTGGGVEATATFAGTNGYDGYARATAVGNDVTGYACATCYGQMTIGSRQTNNADVGASATTNIGAASM